VQFPQIAQLGFVAFAATGVFGFVTAVHDGETRRACSAMCALKPTYAARDRLAPDFALPALGGGTVKLSDYRGKVVILNFWTKNCPPCLEEMPSLVNLAKALQSQKDIVLLTISTDESLEDAKNTLHSVLGGDPPFAVLLDPDSKIVTKTYGTKLYPETWFIDPKGVIRARVDGQRDWASALVVDLAQSLHSPIPCEVTFRSGKMDGDELGVCAELDPTK